MPDIKTRAVAEKVVKTIDKSAIAAQRIKNAYVQAKEKTEHTSSPAKESPEEYAANQISDGTAVATREGAQLFDRQGRKSVEVTKENITKAKEYFQRKRLTGQPKKQATERGGYNLSPVEQGRTNGFVYTVEGNSGDSCRENRYAIGHYAIYGYGTPAY